jgi:Ser/Thr protein kinase RdoA (MazF antagonist)
MALSSDGNGTSFFCRLFDHLPGRPLALVRPHPEALLESVGSSMGRLDAALEGLHHDEQKRFLKWNAANAHAVVEDALGLLEDAGRRELPASSRRIDDGRSPAPVPPPRSHP